MNSSRTRRVAMGILAGVLASAAMAAVPTATVAAPDAKGSKHQQGLGSYGPSGPIERDDLSAGLSPYVSDTALALAASPELAEARESWDDEMDFVGQVDYQLEFRAQADYLSSDASHLADVLSDRPSNAGVSDYELYLTEDEAAELNRRLELGDRIPLVEKELGAEPAAREGADSAYPRNFAGVWQDQMDGGVIVVALVEPELAERADLARLVGGEKNLRVVDVDYSWNDVEDFADTLVADIGKAGAKAEVRINATPDGRRIEVVTPEPAAFDEALVSSVPARLVSVGEGPLDVPEGDPNTTHSAANQMPGLRYDSDPGGWCTWGVNGHTSNYNYIVTAGHCGSAEFENFSGWTNDFEMHQNDSFLLTSGSRFVYSFNVNDYDSKRMSSGYANDNCYHTNGHCLKFIRERAYHNSWEINSDLICATLGNTAAYRCGYVTQENYNSAGCNGDRWIRYSIDTSGGDSGSGVVGRNGSRTSIDGIHNCGSGDHGIGSTAFDVKDKLNFDFNCATSAVVRSAGNWGACPVVNR